MLRKNILIFIKRNTLISAFFIILSKIISYQNLEENYNHFNVIFWLTIIISYQNLEENYNSGISQILRRIIISYQNLEENYNLKERRVNN